MLDRMVKEARQQEIFSREDTPTERRILAAFLYHAGLSYRRSEQFVDRSHEAIRQWFHRLKHLFEPDCQDRNEIAVDETKVEVDGEEVYVWAAVDCETLEVLHVDVSPGQSSLDALLFLKDVLKPCRGRPAPAGDRGPGTIGRSNSSTATASVKRGVIAHSSRPGSGFSNPEPGASGTGFPTIAPSARPNRG